MTNKIESCRVVINQRADFLPLTNFIKEEIMYEITEDEMNGIKATLGEIPAKYSFNLMNFLNSKEPKVVEGEQVQKEGEEE
ncbi:MAG: hypothetical protein GY799_20895 [Desulfobulbaceae bacterium]|nr:hypothetical protein [Desulfobulbaceae bacterium]